MIVRLSQKLNTKLKAGKLDICAADSNPYADWSCHLFTANRAQYIIVSNTASLYSCVMFGRGVTDDNIFVTRACDAIREALVDDGLQFIYEKFIAPSTANVQFSKALNRGVTGSMNDLINHAKFSLVTDDIAPYSLAAKLNQTLLGYLGTPETNGYDRPANVFRSLPGDSNQ